MKKTPKPNRNTTAQREGEPSAKRPYQKPVLRSTDAFEKLALQSCGQLSETAGDCDEL